MEFIPHEWTLAEDEYLLVGDNRNASIQPIVVNKIYANNNVERPKDRYEIKCLGCGAVWYKSRIQSNTIYGYRHGHRYHKQCGCKEFKVVDTKENRIIVNGVEE